MSNIKIPFLLQDYLKLYSTEFPDKNAIILGNEFLTYKSLDRKSDQLAAELIRRGFKKQDRVIILLDNSLETVVSVFGILKAGGIFVNVNSGMKSSKLSYIFNDTKAKFIISHKNKLDVLNSAAANLKTSITAYIIEYNEDDASECFTYLNWDRIFDLSADSEILNAVRENLIDDDLAAILYTSGSTGEPKGIMCPYYSIISVAKSIISYLENNKDDIILNVLPLSFGYGLYQVIVSIIVGSTVVLDKSFMFPVKILQDIEKYKITGFAVVPTIVYMLLNLSSVSEYDLSSLKYITNAGGGLSAKNLLRFKNLFKNARIFSMYGLTECQRVSYLPPDEIEIKPSSTGIPIPNCEVSIVNEDGKEVAPGEIGELIVRGSHVMKGYWNSPQLTEKVFKRDELTGKRYLFSGDLFHRDPDGYLYFHGRKDDLIKTKGERVSPKEIENLIQNLEEVHEAAVIGIPDELLGNVLKAYIVLKTGKSLSEKDVRKYCYMNLENFMVPKFIEFVSELPKNFNGKIDKENLKKMAGIIN